VMITMSSFSNEPYLSIDNNEPRYERTVGNPMDIAYLHNQTNKAPITGGMDYIPTIGEDTDELVLTLVQLDPTDLLYTTSMKLGAKKKLFGLFDLFYLDGPPGMDYYTMPELKNLADLMAFWDIDDEDERFFELYKEHIKSFKSFNAAPVLNHQKEKLYHLLKDEDR